MSSWKYQVLWRLWTFVIFPLLAQAVKKHYVIDYGDGMGEATVEIDEESHAASITPFNSSSPATLMNFRKGIVVYVTNTECLVSKLQVTEGGYKQQLTRRLNTSHSPHTLYVMGSIAPKRVRKLLGEDHHIFCSEKQTFRLSRRRPKLPADIFSVKSEAAKRALRQGTSDVIESIVHEPEHQRYKRKAKKNKKSKERKSKGSKGRRGKEKKGKKSKKAKKPKTKSLRNRVQQLNIKAPRISFPASYVPANFTDTTTVIQDSSDHVVLQEEPYLSSSFVREGDVGQRFRHYPDFYQEVSPSNDSRPSGHSRIISHEINNPGDGDSKILIPETIVKDGQIFYRYDAAEDSVDATKGQSKRSHVREEDALNDGVQIDHTFEYYNDSGLPGDYFPLPPSSHIPEDDDHIQTDHSSISASEFSHLLTQAQMGDGKRDASSVVLSSDGSGSHAQGNSDSGGFFIAQSHTKGRPGGRGTSMAHVFGNTHGVLGSAMTNMGGHQSQVQVDLGAHPSSTAHVATPDGSAFLSSSVHATPLGGRAGAQAFGDGVSASDAHMEFNPSHPFQSGDGALKGQGLASATVTKSGSSLLTSISGEVPGGSYLGTAHSSLTHDQGLPLRGENGTLNAHEEYSETDGIIHEFGFPDLSIDGLSQGSHYEDFIHESQISDHEPYRTDGFADRISSEHVSGGHMVDSIMETVHQPHKHPEFFVYPINEQSIIDESGLVRGAGIPPRESEIEQTPLTDHETLPEGRGTVSKGSKAGIVGLATYSHGQVGAPPGPGELLDYPIGGFQHYDQNYYDTSDYYEGYDAEKSQGPGGLPIFDIGTYANGFEPIESNFENFEPMQLGLPGPPVIEQPSLLPDHTDQPPPITYRYDELDLHDVTTDPPITVHQVLAPTLVPDDPLSKDHIISHTAQDLYDGYYDDTSSRYSSIPTVIPYVSTSFPQNPYITTTASSAAHAPSLHLGAVESEHTEVDPHYDTPSDAGPYEDIQTETHLPLQLPDIIPEQHTTSHIRNETEVPRVPQEHHTRPQTIFQQDTQQQGTSGGTMMMMGIPLNPGNPGSVQYLPGSDGGLDLKVMSVPARHDHSLLYQRQRTSLQPGQNIPGAPGYKVPSGFRGHVIIGDNLPVRAESSRMVQGSTRTTGVSLHSGTGASPWRTGSEASHISQQMVQTHSGMRHQPVSGSISMASWQGAGSGTARKSWDGRPGGGLGASKSWGTPGTVQRVGSGDDCGYYSMNCQPAFGPSDLDEICRPILIMIGCCC